MSNSKDLTREESAVPSEDDTIVVSPTTTLADDDDNVGGEDEYEEYQHADDRDAASFIIPFPSSTHGYGSDRSGTSSMASMITSASFYPSSVHGNLMRANPSHRDPMRYYQIVKVLGEGSMGSVAKVKKKDRAKGGSARSQFVKEERDSEALGCFCSPFLRSFVEKWRATFSRGKNPFFVLVKSSDEISPLVNDRSNESSIQTVEAVGGSSSSKNSSHASGLSPDSARCCAKGTAGKGSKGYESKLRDTWPSTSSLITHGTKRESYYALKSIHLDRCTNLMYMKELKNEVEILKQLDHPNIVKAFETFDYHNRLFLVLELCSGGDLYARDPYREWQAARIVRSLLSAVSYLHEHQIVHRDLKFENVMFSDTECDVDSIKVIDFGLSQKFARNEHLRDAVGTVYTMSPELLTGDYTEKNDVWSVGVICFMLLSSSMPFYGRDRAHVIRRIISGRYSFASRQWRQVSPGAKAFVTSLLELDPDKRPSALDAWKSDWLQGSDDLPSDVENSNMDRIQANVQAFAEYSKLKRLALMVIAYKSTDDEIGILKRMFSRFDRNQNGDITLADFKSTLSGYYNYTDEELEHMFNGIDIDGTGKVHYTEFLAATVESNGSIDEERLAEAFDRIDTDCTGYITVSDLQDFLGPGIPEAYLDAMIDECDVNRDHKISYEEFLSLWNVEADQRLAQANASVHSRRLDSRHNSFDSTYLESNSSLMSSEGSSTLFPDGSHHRVPVLMGQKHNNGRHDGLEVGCGTLAFQKHKRELSNRAPLVA